MLQILSIKDSARTPKWKCVTVTESYTEEKERVNNGDELPDLDIDINEGSDIRFANDKEIKRDHQLFDEQCYGKEYAWLYYNCNKGDYMSWVIKCKSWWK